MIKVCHIITKLELGGAQQNTLYTVRTLNRSRFLPLLITGSEGILIEEARRYRDIKTYFLPELLREIRPHKDFLAWKHIAHILRYEQQETPHIPMIVHTHSSKAGIVGRWAAKTSGISQILHSVHGFGFHPYQPLMVRWIYRMLEQLTAKITTHFIAVSSANIETGLRLKLFSHDRVSLIRSGIDIARFQQPYHLPPAERQKHRTQKLQELQISPEKKIVGMIACFKPQKAPLDFIRVMRIVANRCPEVHAVMVGDGQLRSQIETLIKHYQLESVISLPGWRNDIPELLDLFQILVLTSRWEGLPRVCPQAMAMGVPIVATNVDGIPEAVHEGVNGFLLNPGQVQEMAEKISYLLQHPDIAKQMGKQGQQLVEEFDIQRMVHQQEELYERLLVET